MIIRNALMSDFENINKEIDKKGKTKLVKQNTSWQFC